MGKVLKYGILVFLIAVLIGYFMAKFYPLMVNSKSEANKNVAGNTMELENPEEKVLETANLDEKLLPTAVLTLQKKYQDCKHTISLESELPVEMANLTKDEIAEVYSDWTVKDFSKDKLTLYKIADGICGEHFVINSTDGIVTVYRLDENYEKTLYEKTDIYTEYLSEDDIQKLEEGIYVYGASNLKSTLENFE